MIIKKLHKNSFIALATVLLGLFFLLPMSTLAQGKKIRILNADKQEGKKINGLDVFWLTGNVKYEHEGAIMHCDSSIYYRSQNKFNAYGNVKITQGDSLTMMGDEVTYNGISSLLHLIGKVVLSDGKLQLYCDEIIYDRNLGTAYYNNYGTLIQEESKLTSKLGFYNANTKRFTFKDSVYLQHPQFTIIADTLEYGSENKVVYFRGPTDILSDSAKIYTEKGTFFTNEDVVYLIKNSIITKKASTIKGDHITYMIEAGKGEIVGNAYISDTINKYVVTGGKAIYVEKPEYMLVTEKPLYALNIQNDTLFITGDTLNVTTDEEAKRNIKVYNHAKFYKSDFQGKCDSLTYSETDSTFQLYHQPVVWNEQNQLTADFIFMTTRLGSLDSLNMIGNAFLIEMEDSTKFNQIKGRNMYGKFYENELRKIYVSGNGQTVYYAYDEEDKQIGINRADCSDLLIKIIESRVQRVTFLKKPNATLYPPGRIPKGELFLKGFNPRFDEQLHSKEELFH